MFRTVILATYFWLIMLVSVIFLPVFYTLKIFSWNAASAFLKTFANQGVKLMFHTAGIKVSVKGIRNLPETSKICFISNHQSYLDIPVLVTALPRQIGFAAKRELNRIPIINIWMHALGCVIIDRGNPSESMKKMKERIDKIDKDKPLVIFPEGTRSRSGKVRRFKTGGISLLTPKNLLVVPVTINGTYHLLEEKSRLKPGKVEVMIHPAISTGNIDEDDYKKFAKELEEIIKEPLEC
jgi:1-acyl-sn-glycerol-3-phosphate acyltransferase